MTSNYIDLTGIKVGRLTALERISVKGQPTRWLCLCECGNKHPVLRSSLTEGKAVSCGCYRRERASKALTASHTTHGLSFEPVYNTWKAMKRRCLNPDYKAFKDYGGRGIKICEFLKFSAANIVSCIGERPIGMSIDRIDNNLHYSCGNCQDCLKNSWSKNIRWNTRSGQSRNTRSNNFIIIDGVSRCIAEWAEISGLHFNTIYHRLKTGKTGQDIICAPTK